MFAIPLDTTPEAPPSQLWPDGIPPAGTIDGQAAFANDGEFSIYEMSHPLDSGDDAHDFSLKPGDTVGFLIFLNVGFAPPTIFPANGWGDILISSPVLPVEIDIKPGNSANSINVRDQGLLPVAVLSDVAFDAHDIDPRTVRLGGVGLATRGPASTLKLAYSYEDINDDGDLDLVVFFRVQDLVAANALTTSTTQLTLTANTYSGIPLEGSDSVSVVPAP